jgi:hypothetical protein
MRETVRALMILNEINVDVAKVLSHDKFEAMQSKIDDVKSILLNQLFPDDRSEFDKSGVEINWSGFSTTTHS